MSGIPGAGETPMQVDGWNDGSGVLLLGGSKQYGIRLATRAVRNGVVFTIDIPRTAGGPPDGETAIRRVHNVFPARSDGSRAYTRTPSTCPASGVWTFTARLTFADGVVERDVYSMRCERPRRHVHRHRHRRPRRR